MHWPRFFGPPHSEAPVNMRNTDELQSGVCYAIGYTNINKRYIQCDCSR